MGALRVRVLAEHARRDLAPWVPVGDPFVHMGVNDEEEDLESERKLSSRGEKSK